MESEGNHSKNILVLHRAFYKNLDASLLNIECDRIIRAKTKPVKIPNLRIAGEGHFFTAYALHSDNGPKTMTYALLIPHNIGGHLMRTSIARQDWERGIVNFQKISRLRVSKQEPFHLIPPILILKTSMGLGLALPYGETSPRAGELDSAKLRQITAKMHQELQDAGFQLEDSLQIRYWNGIAFIHDFSDLRQRRK